MAGPRLGVADYISLSLMLVISAVIGLVAAFTGDRQKTSSEYLLANRKMNFFIAGVSIMISFSSAIGIVGLPAEIYFFGTTAWWAVVGNICGTTLVAVTVLPVFYRLKLTSIYTVNIKISKCNFTDQ